MRCAMLAVFAFGSVCVATEAKPFTPLDLKDIKTVQPKEGDALKPTEIKSAEELSKSPLFGAGAAEKLGKLVNFEKEKLVVFAWRGSGQDAVTGVLMVAEGKKATASFTYKPGLTRDLREHFQAFAVPKDVEVKAAKVKE